MALSVCIQRMVRSDMGAAGVMFTLDTELGFRDEVFINAADGLAQTVVQGAVNPDEFFVHKPTLARGYRPVIRKKLGDKASRLVFASETTAGHPTRVEELPAAYRQQLCLTDEEILELARCAMIIEDHYGRPMDIEWGRGGLDGRLYTCMRGRIR